MKRVSTGSFIYSCDSPYVSFLPGPGHIEIHAHSQILNRTNTIASSLHPASGNPQHCVFFIFQLLIICCILKKFSDISLLIVDIFSLII